MGLNTDFLTLYMKFYSFHDDLANVVITNIICYVLSGWVLIVILSNSCLLDIRLMIRNNLLSRESRFLIARENIYYIVNVRSKLLTTPFHFLITLTIESCVQNYCD